jgi:hypothetical protein
VGLCLAFAFYFLPTRVHERYLFPALALAAPFAAVHLPSLVAYLGLSIGFALSLLRVLVLTAGLEIAPWFDEALTAEATVWILGAVLIGSAVALVWLTLRGAGAPLVERAAVSAAPG